MSERGGQTSGTAERKRPHVRNVRLSSDELASLNAAAQRSGLALGGYLRASALGTPGVRAMRTRPVNKELFALALAAQGRLGSNVNQLAKAFNQRGDEPLANELAKLAEDSAALRAMFMEALGFTA